MKLSDYLEQNNLTDAEFGVMIGKDRSSVTRLRAGSTKPSWDTAQKIADATHGAVTPNDFLPEQEAGPHRRPFRGGEAQGASEADALEAVGAERARVAAEEVAAE